MAEPGSSLIAALWGVGGALLTGLAVVFHSGRTYQKMLSEVQAGRAEVSALKELIQTKLDHHEGWIEAVKEDAARANRRIDEL